MTGAILAAALFCLGLYAILTHRDVVGILVGVEVMVAGALLMLVVMGSRAADGASIHGAALLVLVFTAAEAAVGLALLVAAARRLSTTRIDEMTEVKG